MNKMPTRPPEPPRFVSHIPGRRPLYKFHNNVGQGKNAIRLGIQQGRHWLSGNLELFEWLDGDWVLLYSVDPKTKESELPWI